MKQIYLLLFFMGTFGLAAQQTDAVAGSEEARIRLHPNPATTNVVYIESDSRAPKTVRVFDLFGKVVLERRLSGDALAIVRDPQQPLAPGAHLHLDFGCASIQAVLQKFLDHVDRPLHHLARGNFGGHVCGEWTDRERRQRRIIAHGA